MHGAAHGLTTSGRFLTTSARGGQSIKALRRLAFYHLTTFDHLNHKIFSFCRSVARSPVQCSLPRLCWPGGGQRWSGGKPSILSMCCPLTTSRSRWSERAGGGQLACPCPVVTPEGRPELHAPRLPWRSPHFIIQYRNNEHFLTTPRGASKPHVAVLRRRRLHFALLLTQIFALAARNNRKNRTYDHRNNRQR